MARNLSPVLRREFENLDKDTDTRKLAMKALKSYVKDLDSNSIPIFLAQLSETKQTGLTSGEYTISLYEVLARVHGPKIVPQIDNIMLTVINTLNSSAGSLPLHQACSKVGPAVARYGMDPTTSEVKKQDIIHRICKPLSDCLLSSHENLSSGSALCLKALVDSDNWRFCSKKMVNEVCQKVAASLEKFVNLNSDSNSRMGLVMSLAKRNGLVLGDYARLLIRSGVGILKTGDRLSAIQMVNFLLKSLDYECVVSELAFVIEEMENCRHDEVACVKRAAFEAVQTAKRLLTENEDRLLSLSPRSETGDFGSISYSPFSVSFGSNGSDRSINRKVWRNVDVSLKDGLFSGDMGTPRSVIESIETRGDCEDGFSGFLRISANNGYSRSATPSPQRTRSYVNTDNMDIFATPTNLVKSLQIPTDNCSENQTTRFKSPYSSNSDHDLNEPFTNEDQQFNSTSESVSSTEYIIQTVNDNVQPVQEHVPENKVESESNSRTLLSVVSIASGLIVLLIAFIWVLWIRGLDQGDNLVPT